MGSLNFNNLNIVADQQGFLFIDKNSSKKMEFIEHEVLDALIRNISAARSDYMGIANNPQSYSIGKNIREQEKQLGRKFTNEEFLEKFFKLAKDMPTFYNEQGTNERKEFKLNNRAEDLIKALVKFRRKNGHDKKYIIRDSLQLDEYNRFIRDLAKNNPKIITTYTIKKTEDSSKQTFHFRQISIDSKGEYTPNGKLDELVIEDSFASNNSQDQIDDKKAVNMMPYESDGKKLQNLDYQTMFNQLDDKEKALLEIKHIPKDANERYIGDIIYSLDEKLFDNPEFVIKAIDSNPAMVKHILENMTEDVVLEKNFLVSLLSSKAALDGSLVKHLFEKYGANSVLGVLDNENLIKLLKQNRSNKSMTETILKFIESVDDEELKTEVLKSLAKYPGLYDALGEKIKSDSKIVFTVLKNGKSFYGVPDKFFRDREFVLSLVKYQPSIIEASSNRLRGDWTFMEEAMQLNPKSFRYFSDDMQKFNPLEDKKTAIALLKEDKNGRGKSYLRYFTDSVRLDPDVSKTYIHNRMSHDLGIKFTDKEADLIIKHYPEVDVFANLVKGQSKEKILALLKAKDSPSNEVGKFRNLYMFATFGFKAFEGDIGNYTDPANSGSVEHSLNIVSKDKQVNQILQKQSSSNTKVLNWIIAAHGSPGGVRFGGEENGGGGNIVFIGGDEEETLDVDEKEHYEKWKPHIRNSFNKEGVLVLHSCATAKELEENDENGELQRVVNFAENMAITIFEVINSKENQAKEQGEKLENFTIYAAAEIASSEGGFPKPKYDKQGKIIDVRFNVYDRREFIEQIPFEPRVEGKSGKEIRRDLQAKLQKPTLKFVVTSKGIECYQRVDKLDDEFGEWTKVENPETLKQYSIK